MTEDTFKYIDVERTIEEFGYDPRELSHGSSRKVFAFCSVCSKQKKPIAFSKALLAKKCLSCGKKKGIKYSKTQETIEPFFTSINIDRTIKDFNYDPRNFKKTSNKKVWCKCSECNEERIIILKVAANNKPCANCTQKNKYLKIQCLQIDISKFINIEKTIACFGYDPRKLSENSSKKVFSFCSDCKKEKGAIRMQRATNNSKCRKCAAGSGEKNHRFGTTIDRVIVEKMAASKRGKKIIKTEKMLTHYERMKGHKLTPENKEKLRQSRIGAKIPNSTGSWYIRRNGEKLWLRSSWEIKFASFLDEQKKDWHYEAKIFPVIFIINGVEKNGTYRPDFLVDNEWFEVKGWWGRNQESKPKFEAFKAQYPDEKITLLMKPELLALGIKVK